MVSYIKHNFFVRCRSFKSWTHLNQLAEKWLAEGADQRLHGTVREVVAERFEREKPCLHSLPIQHYDTSYREFHLVAWDSYIEVNGNRYSVPNSLCGQTVEGRIGLDDSLRVYDPKDADPDKLPVTRHILRSIQGGWVTVPEHHNDLWKSTMQVEQRPLAVYEEATQWS